MDKRIVVFSPEFKVRGEILGLVIQYFFENFKEYWSQIKTEDYSALNEPPTRDQIGHWGLGEILTVMDRRFCPQQDRFRSLGTTPYYKALKISYEMSKNLCEKENIPYVIYEGEIFKKSEDRFLAKIEKIKNQIKGKLELKL